MMLDRRSFLRRAGGAAFAPSLAGLAACVDDRVMAPSLGPRHAVAGSGSYGPLTLSADCPELFVPDGFRCVKLSETLLPSRANPEFIVPQAFDGMAAFSTATSSRVRLVRNHEIRDPSAVASPFAPNAYDMKAGGGTTSLEVAIRRTGSAVVGVDLIAEWPTLSGTHVNCAGGPTPWGSWISCEETTEGPSHGRDEAHGYCFEVSSRANRVVTPRPLKAMGRFVHEAIAVDPSSGIIYETEDFTYNPVRPDQPGSGFYRFIPTHAGLPHEGKLQVLVVAGADRYDTTTGQTVGHMLPCTWADIDDPDPAAAETDPSAVFREGLSKGAAIFQRLEGCWYGDFSIFFNATSGGDAGAGQVWQYRPTGADTGELILVFESPSAAVLDSPDNITVSKRGGIVLCEDGGGEQYLRGLTQSGDIFDFVKTNGNLPEFCGACFAPGAEDVLFFNVQGSTSSTGAAHGYTFAMWGPWHQGAL
jgi:secreted PhoX family phosphatase